MTISEGEKLCRTRKLSGDDSEEVSDWLFVAIPRGTKIMVPNLFMAEVHVGVRKDKCISKAVQMYSRTQIAT